MARALSDVLGPRSYGGQSPLPKKLRFFTSKSGTEWVHLDEALALLIRVCAETPVVKPEEQNVEPQKNTTRECPVVKCGPCVCAPCAQPPPCEKCDECKRFILALQDLWLAPDTASDFTDYLSGKIFCQNPDNGFVTDDQIVECQAGLKEFIPVAFNVLFSGETDGAESCYHYFDLCANKHHGNNESFKTLRLI